MMGSLRGEEVKRKYMTAILILIIIGIVTTGISAFRIVKTGLSAKPEKSDCILVLGCRVYGNVPSPMLKARLDEAVRLYNEGYGKYIIVSGGKGAGEDVTEAEAMRTYLISKRINKSVIIIEDKSTSTFQNIVYSEKKMDEKNFNSAVVVSNKYHLKRASLMAQKVGVNASFSGVFSYNLLSYEIHGFLREIPALWKYYLLGS